jgi:hypothetical protein
MRFLQNLRMTGIITGPLWLSGISPVEMTRTPFYGSRACPFFHHGASHGALPDARLAASREA